MQCHSQCMYVRAFARSRLKQFLMRSCSLGPAANEMKVISLSCSLPLPAAIRPHRPGACARLTAKASCVRAFSRDSFLAGSTAPVSNRLAISVDSLGVGFGVAGARKQVLSGASLEVQQGTFHILLGPNGCGKSTLLRVLGGLLDKDSGSFQVAAPIGFVFQNPDNQVVMPTVAADVAFGLGRYLLAEEDVLCQVQHALLLVGMEAFQDRPTHTLSGGQKQRVAIAGALAECPKVLLLDELTTFLDSADQEGVLKAVRGIIDTQGSDPVTALWVTHRLEELQWADTASYMEQGKIQFTGPAQEVAKYMKSLGAH